MIEHIPELVKSGIMSFKIEGRMKSSYYVATAVKAYREALDSYLADPEGYVFQQKWMDYLLKASHRRYSTGFYFGEKGKQIFESSSYIRDYDIVGIVQSFDSLNGIATVEQKNRVFEGDKVEILRAKGDSFEVQLNDMKDLSGKKIEVAPHAEMKFTFSTKSILNADDMLVKAKEKIVWKDLFWLV